MTCNQIGTVPRILRIHSLIAEIHKGNWDPFSRSLAKNGLRIAAALTFTSSTGTAISNWKARTRTNTRAFILREREMKRIARFLIRCVQDHNKTATHSMTEKR